MHPLDWPFSALHRDSWEGRRPSRKRRDRAFRPDRIHGLEARIALSAVGAPEQRSIPAGSVIEYRNIEYPALAGPVEQLDVYLPEGPVPPGGRPVLIAIHGGGWRRFSKSGYGARIAGGFVPQGYVVVAPNYELSAPGRPSWPINLEDVQAVVTWVGSHAVALGINPNQIAAIGESAGGNLAELLGTHSGPAGPAGVATRVDAVVAFSAPSNLTVLFHRSSWVGRAAAQFLGGSPRQVPASYAAASPIEQVSPGDPPMLLVHGRQDPLVPVGQSEALAAALSGAGVPNQLIRVPGGHLLDFPAHYSELIPKVLEFLDATWKDN